MKQLIIINGTGRSGKDTFMGFVREIGQEHDISVYSFSSIDPVKAAAGILDYSEERKTDEARTFLHELKKAWIKFNDGPFNYLKREIESIDDGIIFLQMREGDEIRKFIESFPETKTLFITREAANELNISTPVDGFGALQDFTEYDIRIQNDGSLEELYEKSIQLVRKLTGFSNEVRIK